MSVAKVRASSNSDPVKLEGHSSFDKFITQATGREPFLSFTRTNDVTTTTWDQLLSTFKHMGGNKISNSQKVETGVGGASKKMTKSVVETVPSLKIPEAVVAFAQAAAKANGEPEKYLPGWPLLSPTKFQMQKCTKCSLEFCSSVNYKRHIRTHRKSNIHEKASPKSREFLASFWDKISVDESRELVSLKDSALMLEIPDKVQKVAASSIIARLASSIRKPGFSCLPHVYAKAGMALLDVIQANNSVFPISSQELFKLLDEASEKTFLCAGSASSLLRFLLDGDVENTVLDMKNIVACTSLLLELELFKAWHADKDAEALRCQKLLVEEEEAAQKRRVGLTERRRRKKLRQKELKAKDNTGVNKDLTEICDSTSFMESLAPRAASYVEMDSEASSSSSQSCFAASPLLHFKGETDGHSPDACDQNGDLQMLQIDGQCDLRTISDLGNSLNGFPSSHVAGVKGTVTEKNYVQKTSKSSSLNVGQKVWTRKVKHESQDLKVTAQSSTDVGSGETLKPIENNAVMIGTIPVSLGDCVRGNTMRMCQSDLPVKTESNLNNAGRIVKWWRPVSRQGKSDHSTCQNNNIRNSDVCNEMANSSLLDKNFASDSGGNDHGTRMDSSMPERTENASRPIMKLWRPVSRHGERDNSECQRGNSENRDVCKEGRICSGGSFFDETTTSSQPKSFSFSNDGGNEVSPDRRGSAMLECTEPSVSPSHISEAHLKQEKFHQSSCRHGTSDSSTCQSDEDKSSDVCCELTISFESNVCTEVSSSLQDNFCTSDGGGDDAGHVRLQSSMLESTKLAAPLLPSLIANSIERRWNQAIASDHVKWAHTCAQPMDCPYTRKEGNSADVDIEAPDCSEYVNVAAISVQQAAAFSGLQKFRIKGSKVEKVNRVEYVPKQKQ